MRNATQTVGWMLLTAVAVLLWAPGFQTDGGDRPPIRSPIEQAGSDFIREYAAASAEAYRVTQLEAGRFESLAAAKQFHEAQLAPARLAVFEATLQPVFDTVNGKRWDADKFAQIMGHLADGMDRHAKD